MSNMHFFFFKAIKTEFSFAAAEEGGGEQTSDIYILLACMFYA